MPSALGKEPAAIEQRWSGLVDRGVVGVLPGRYSPKNGRTNPSPKRAREDDVGDEIDYFGRGEMSLSPPKLSAAEMEARFRERRFRRGNGGRGVGGRKEIWEEWKN